MMHSVKDLDLHELIRSRATEAINQHGSRLRQLDEERRKIVQELQYLADYLAVVERRDQGRRPTGGLISPLTHPVLDIPEFQR